MTSIGLADSEHLEHSLMQVELSMFSGLSQTRYGPFVVFY